MPLCTKHTVNTAQPINTVSPSWPFDDGVALGGVAPVGDVPALVAATTIAFDATDGWPNPGSAVMTVPFSGAYQQIEFEMNLGGPLDFGHKILSCWVRVNSCNPTGSINVGLAYKSVVGQWIWGGSPLRILGPSDGWTQLTLNLETPGGVVDTHIGADGGRISIDPTQTLEFDVVVESTSSASGTVVLSIDTLGMSDAP